MSTTGFHKKEAKNWAPSASWKELFASLDDFTMAVDSILSSKSHEVGDALRSLGSATSFSVDL